MWRRSVIMVTMFAWIWAHGFILPKSVAAQALSDRMLEHLRPQTTAVGALSGYARLQQALVHYQDIAAQGGWPLIPAGARMQKGDKGKRVALLRARLMVTGEIKQQTQGSGDRFDDVLEQAVRTFQERHGLESDGIVGPATLAALNVPVEARVRQIELNLARWRQLPQDLGPRYILVNVPNFLLETVENDQSILPMRVVVGKKSRCTPVLSSKIVYLVINPYWYIPRSIALQDILPKIRKDPNYLRKNNIKVFRGWEAEGEVNPATIDWSTMTAKNFLYTLRQEPSPLNALGRIKFIFPNPYNVYLHDTPARELFQRTVRTFSSGCIRIEKPLELAVYLLQNDPKWTPITLSAAMEKGEEQIVWLPEPIPIHLVYWTAWVRKDGSIQFRDDIYGRDKQLDETLHSKPPPLP